MFWRSELSLSAVLIAIAYFTDIIYLRRYPKVYDRFFACWEWLSTKNLRQLVEKGASQTMQIVEWIFGIGVFSIRSVVVSILLMFLVTGTRLAMLSPPSKYPMHAKVLALLIFSLPAVVAGLPVLLVVQLLMRNLTRRPTIHRLLTLFAINAVCLIALFCAVTLVYGFGVQKWIEHAYSQSVTADDSTGLIDGSYTIYLGVVNIYGSIVIIPAILFAAVVFFAVAVHLLNWFLFVSQEFLRGEIEKKEWSRPFTSIAIAITMALTLLCGTGSLISTLLSTKHFVKSEHWLRKRSFEFGRRLEGAHRNVGYAHDERYGLYAAECEATVVLAEWMGPNAQSLNRFWVSVHNIWPKWPIPHQDPTPADPRLDRDG